MQNQGCTEKQQAVGTFSTRIPYKNADASPMLIFRAWATCDSTPFFVFFLHCRAWSQIAWDQAAHWGKKKKKSASEASREVVWGGERVAEAPPPFPPPQATAGLSSLAEIFPFFPTAQPT